jgi:hypothetical protein
MIVWYVCFCFTACDFASWIKVSVRMNDLFLLLQDENNSSVSESKFLLLSSYCKFFSWLAM